MLPKKKRIFIGAISVVTSKDIEKVRWINSKFRFVGNSRSTFRMADGRPGASANIKFVTLFLRNRWYSDAGQFGNIAPNDIEIMG